MLCAYAQDNMHFYPRPPRGGRRYGHGRPYRSTAISIHALREEGDHGLITGVRDVAISIHALREEGDEPFRLGLRL